MTALFDPQLTLLLKTEMAKQALPDSFFDTIKQYLLPISKKINAFQEARQEAVIISFNGSQGSGKSTLTHFISLILNHYFKKQGINLSLDNFYLTKQQRIKLSRSIHPLLLTRGVPGTHDLQLAISTLTQLKTCSPQNPCFIPQFDKAKDDRSKKALWQKIEKPTNIILFEGWCNHAPIDTEKDLLTPINALERDEDPHHIWRCYVNEQLKIYHQQLFSLCHQLYFIKIPSFQKVYDWRGLQEQKLGGKNVTKGMNNHQLVRFIQHYERITRLCLNQLSEVADTVIELDDAHKIKQVFSLNP